MHALRRLSVPVVLLMIGAAVLMAIAACSSGPEIDAEFPPGNPAMEDDIGDNPVMGSEGPGEIAEADETNYGLLVVIAVMLIAAGVLLVKVEAWERRRSRSAGQIEE